jgi:hypothetical protein
MWLVVTTQRVDLGPSATGGVYTGTLYRTTGPAFNATPWNPAQVVATAVGTATFTFSSIGDATFAYTVNGVSQSRPLVREVFATPTSTCN